MRTPTDPADPTDPHSTALTLPGGHHLIVEDGQSPRSLVHLRGPGPVQLTIEITPAGPVLRFQGPALALDARGGLAIAADRVSIHAREDLQLSAGGDVRVRANDDVTLNGERVLLNC